MAVRRGEAAPVVKDWKSLPANCPKCGEFCGTIPATFNDGHWWRHRFTGFQGVQCGRCGFLVKVAIPW